MYNICRNIVASLVGTDVALSSSSRWFDSRQCGIFLTTNSVFQLNDNWLIIGKHSSNSSEYIKTNFQQINEKPIFLKE